MKASLRDQTRRDNEAVESFSHPIRLLFQAIRVTSPKQRDRSTETGTRAGLLNSVFASRNENFFSRVCFDLPTHYGHFALTRSPRSVAMTDAKQLQDQKR